MKKFQEALYNLALSDLPTANDADTLYRSSKDLNDDELSIWVIKNQDELVKVLNFPSVMDDNVSDWKKDMMREFFDVRNAGVDASKGDKRDVMGNKIRSVDDYMKAFGYMKDDGTDINDKDRAAFTNKDNPKYWGNYDQSKKEQAAVTLGRDRFSEIEGDLTRAGDEYQRHNEVEGYDANGELSLYWIVSALKGLAAPRVKEAQLAGRDPSLQDIAGDIAELGLNFVPGVGIADKFGTVVYKAPWLRSDMAKAIGQKLAFGTGFVGESVAQPLLTQAMDVNLLYNPEALGEATSGLNTRSQFSKEKLLAQTMGIGAGKGVVKGYGARMKNSLEQSLGDEAGGAAYKGGFKEFVGNLGNKTDDMIARRQAMLDRKAELARQNADMQSMVELGNAPLKKTGYDIEDIINAENYRALTSEAKRISNAQKASNIYAHDAEKNWLTFRNANEAGDIAYLAQLPDGRVLPVKYFDENGVAMGGLRKDVQNVTPLEYKYDDAGNMVKDAEVRIDRMGGVEQPDAWGYRYVRQTEDGLPAVESRNAVVKEQIEGTKYPELARKMNGANWLSETTRDAGANAMYNMFAREGYANVAGNVGSLKDIDEKRQQALWHSMLGKLRDFTANPRISLEDRAKYADAIMNVMNYGLDGLSDEQFAKYPQIYHNIAIKLGVDDWKHPSERENDIVPTASSSTTY